MKALSIVLLLLITALPALAKKTWEKNPKNWSLEDCERVQTSSPWCSESYKPLSGDDHYLVKAQWVSPVIVCAEAREEQLDSGQDLKYLQERYNERLKQEGLDKNKIIKINVFPMKGVGMVGQNLHELYSSDPFFRDLSQNIKLVRNKNRDDFISPKDFKPLGSSLSDGFQVVFPNDGFISARTWRAELLLESEAGEFKFIFEPRKMKPFDLKFKTQSVSSGKSGKSTGR